MAGKFKIKKGDRVVVVTGRDRGRQGEVLRVLRAESRVLVQGVNMVKRHTKPNARTGGGGIVEKEAPIHISNVACIDPQSSRPTRVGYRFLEDGRKVRFAKRSGEVLSN
ncbi:MAG: 50S ribosomal protein L24 [Alphaproteobacteria bacterium]|nr:50S ribosomal protein L24 [Alphaproteobacteria bacterium]